MAVPTEEQIQILSWKVDKLTQTVESLTNPQIQVEAKTNLQVVKDNTFTSYTDFPKFTEKGYKKIKVPEDAWNLIQKIYLQLLDKQIVEEEFDGKAHYITGDEKTSELLDIAQLSAERDELHRMLLPLHEEFSGQKLNPSYLYGIRSYLKGSDLKLHKDRIETHHIASIIQVDKNLKCGCKNKENGADWPLDIQAHDGTWEKVYLEPGEMVLYESAACQHGRTERFEGTYFRNMFLHYKLQDWTYAG